MLSHITRSRPFLSTPEVVDRLTTVRGFVGGWFTGNRSRITQSSIYHHHHHHNDHHNQNKHIHLISSSVDHHRIHDYVVSESFDSSSYYEDWTATCWEAFRNICDKLYSPVTVVAVTFSYIHLMMYLFLASITIVPGILAKMLTSYFYSYHASQYRLSPFAPVWFSLEDFPFSSLTMYVDAFIRLNTVLLLVIVIASGTVYWRPVAKSTDLRFLLIYTTLLLCSFKMISIVSPQCYTRIMTGLNGEQMWNLMGEYKVAGGDSVSCVFNMFMIIGKCCGVYGPEDFSNLPYNLTIVSGRPPATNFQYNSHYNPSKHRPQWLDKNMTIPFKVPAACCPQNRLDEDPDEDWTSLRKCVSGQEEKSHYTKGCREAFKSSMEENLLPGLIADDVATVAIFVCFSIVHTMKLYNTKYRISQDSQIECDYEGDDDEKEEEEEIDDDDEHSERCSCVPDDVPRTSDV